MKRTILLASVLLLSACGQEGGYEQVVVSQILMGSSVNENDEVVEEENVFVPTDETIHAHAFIDGLLEPTETVAEWWYGEGADEQKIYETRVKATPEMPVAKFFLTNVRGWPEGTYSFVIRLLGKEVERKTFRVVSDTL